MDSRLSIYPSLHPLHSDVFTNAKYIEQLAAPLVRLGRNAQYEGYLAKSWTVSEDKKLWTFSLHENLFCEDGSKINAASFAESLAKTLALFKADDDVPIFNQLKDWEQLKIGDSSFSGIYNNNKNELVFEFTTSPSIGFIEYLALPMSAFYCENNFNKDGLWKNNSQIIASGPYKLKSDDFNHLKGISLEKNPLWNKNISTPEFDTINLYHENKFLESTNPYKIIYSGKKSLLKSLKEKNNQLVKRIKENLIYIKFSNDRLYKFNIKERQQIQKAIYESRALYDTSEMYSEASNSFYPHLSNPEKIKQLSYNPETTDTNISLPILNLTIGTYSKNPTSKKYIESLSVIAKKYNINLIIENITQNSGTREKLNIDLHLGSVFIGGGIENQLIKFMFCSNLGVNFPDPSGRICKLVDKYEKKYGDYMDAESLREYTNEFDKIIFEDAAVFPIIKIGGAWVASPAVDTSYLIPSSAIPYFDWITPKK